MKAILLLCAVLPASLVPASADTVVTVKAKVPIEQIAPDGSVSGVSMSVPGGQYNFVKVGPEGVDGQSEIIIASASGQQYRIAISATDYQPSPVVPPTNAPSVNVTAAVTNAPPPPASTPASESEVTTFLEDAGLTARFDRLMSKMSNPVTRRFNDEDAVNLQTFESQLASSDVRAKYRAIFVAAATKAYSQFTPDDLAAIKAFLVGPLAAANAANEPAIPAIPNSLQDKIAQNIKRNDYGANRPYDEIITQVHSTFSQIGLPTFTTSFVRSLPQRISAGEIDGITEGLLASPSYGGRDKEVDGLADSAKKMPMKSKYQQDLDNQIARQEKSSGRPPIVDDTILRQREEEKEATVLAVIYTSILTDDQAKTWMAFATSPTGKKFYALRIAALQAVIDAVEKDWYQERHDAAKAWAQSNSDEAFALLKSLSTPPATR